MPEGTACRLDYANVRVLIVEVVRIDLDTKREAYEPALEVTGPGARYATLNSDVPHFEQTPKIVAAPTADARPYRLRPLIGSIPYTLVSRLDEVIYIAECSIGGGILLNAPYFQH